MKRFARIEYTAIPLPVDLQSYMKGVRIGCRKVILVASWNHGIGFIFMPIPILPNQVKVFIEEGSQKIFKDFLY